VEGADGTSLRVTLDHGMFLYATHAVRLTGVRADPKVGADVQAWLTEHAGHEETVAAWPFVAFTERDHHAVGRYAGQLVCGVCHANLNEYLRDLGHAGTG